MHPRIPRALGRSNHAAIPGERDVPPADPAARARPLQPRALGRSCLPRIPPRALGRSNHARSAAHPHPGARSAAHPHPGARSAAHHHGRPPPPAADPALADPALADPAESRARTPCLRVSRRHDAHYAHARHPLSQDLYANCHRKRPSYPPTTARINPPSSISSSLLKSLPPSFPHPAPFIPSPHPLQSHTIVLLERKNDGKDLAPAIRRGTISAAQASTKVCNYTMHCFA
jgi:hypothetical protein